MIEIEIGFHTQEKIFCFSKWVIYTASQTLTARIQSRHVVAHGGTRTLDQSNGKRKSTLLCIVGTDAYEESAMGFVVSIQFTHATADTAVVAVRCSETCSRAVCGQIVYTSPYPRP